MKRTLLKLAALAAVTLGGLELLGNVAALVLTAWLKNRAMVETTAASAGIIGGADGPTAVFVTTSPGYIQWLLPILLMAAGIWGLLRLKKCNK